MDFNKLCADFLGFEYLGDGHSPDYLMPNGVLIDSNDLTFDKDWNSFMLVKQAIESIRLPVPGYNVEDWFSVTISRNHCIITSGLRHADSDIRSPYHYEEYVFDSSADKAAIRAVTEFINWFKTLNILENDN